MMLLPFVRVVIGMLMVMATMGAIAGVARIHMIILSFLSAGLLISLAFFESEYKKQVRRAQGGGGGGGMSYPSSSSAGATTGGKNSNKTD